MTADPLESQTGLSKAQRSLRARIAANTRWANTIDRTAATAPARLAREAAFAEQVDPHGELMPAERQKRAENARTAFYQQMSMKAAARHRQGRA